MFCQLRSSKWAALRASIKPIALVLLLVAGIAQLPVASHATSSGSISGFGDSSTTTKNLTSEGTLDWTHWGNGGAPGLDRKSGVFGLLSNYSLISAATVTAYTGDPHPMAWSDGTPTASASSSTTGVRVSGQNNGFVVTAPADTSQHVYWIYCGGTDSSATLTIHLSDGSAADYVDTLPVTAGAWNRGYTIFYNTATAGQSITVTWKQTSAAGSVTLSAATLEGSFPAPPAPTGVTATPGNGQVALSWTGSTLATSYNVKRSTVSGGPYTTVSTQSPWNYTDTGLTNGTHYYYVITGSNAPGEGPNSTEVSATPGGGSIPPAPTGLNASPGTAQVSLSWNVSTGATSYNVKRSTTTGSGYTTVASPLNTSATDLGLTNGVTYYYVVSAVNSSGESPNSPQVSATPSTSTNLVVDFNGDGKGDILLQNPVSHQTAVWYMNGFTVSGGAYFSPNLPANWTVVGSGDFNGDGHPDLVLQNTAIGKVAIWYMNGTTLLTGQYVSASLASGWNVVTVADVDHNGAPDLILENDTSHQAAAWTMNGATVVQGQYLGQLLPSGWHIAAAADFDGNGQPDLVLQNGTTNQAAIWYLGGNTGGVVGGAYLSMPPPANWLITGTGDFNYDGHPDLILENLSTGHAAFWIMNNATVSGGQYISLPLPAGWSLVGNTAP